MNFSQPAWGGTGHLRRELLLCAGLALAAAPAVAQSGPQPDDAQVGRDRVTVTATRVESAADDVPATVTVITDREIEDELVTDIKDLVRFEPGVSVRNSPARFGAALGSTGRDGNAGFNVRGLEGNRVLIQVDGVRLPDAYTFGPQTVGRGGYVDLDLLQSVEIVRGPASALYGSDGLAGSVSFITRDPDSMIADGNQVGLRARTSYSSADESWANSVIGATETGDWSGLLAYTRRDSSEQENQGDVGGEGPARTEPNPTDAESNSWLAKVVYAPGDRHRFRLTYEGSESEVVANVLSARESSLFTGQTTLDLTGVDTTQRERVAFDHSADFGQGFLRRGKWSVYTQDSSTRQFSSETRTPGPSRARDNSFDTSVVGASGQIEASANTNAVEHALLVGADWSSTGTATLRDGTVPPFGETFPSRASPVTDYALTGVFVQDQISLFEGQLLIYPGLRYDAYELEPKRDDLYPANFPAEPSEGDRVSPRLGVVAWPTDQFGVFANYAEGFKAPAPGQINEGFENLLFGYTTLANPDLDPETSKTLEGGVRFREVDLAGARWSGSITAYAGDYEDFISNQVVAGTGAPGDPLQFQYINLTEVEISGIEFESRGQWSNGFGVRLAASSSEGEVIGTPDTPLQTIDPAQAVAGFTYDDPAQRFGGQLIATWLNAKQRGDVADPTLFRPGSIVFLDATAYWNLTDAVAMRAGVFNITDEKFWYWSDVRGVVASSSSLDAYTQPGRNYSISLTYRY